MSFMENSPAHIECMQLTKSGKIKHTTLQNLLNTDRRAMGLVEINLFGISQVYSLLDFDKIKKFESLFNESKANNQIGHLTLAKSYSDDPLENDVNMKSKLIDFNKFTIFDWINFYQINSVISGLNIISEMTVNDSVEYTFSMQNNLFDISEIDFNVNKSYRYIIIYEDGYTLRKYVFSNKIPNDYFSAILINIPETNCWQYLSRRKFEILTSISGLEIRYAVTDSPRCFSSIGYHQEYCVENIDDLVKLGIYIPMDIYFNKVFDEYEPNRKLKTGYDALDIYVKHHNYNCSVLLTHKELGIEYTGENHIWYNDKTEADRIQYIEDFQLLKLIINIISLKPY